MSEWYAEVNSLVPQGQLGEVLVVARIDRMKNTAEIMQPQMVATTMTGIFPMPDGDSPFFDYAGQFGARSGIDAFLQCMMDLAWSRGLRPHKFDPSAGELAAVKAHLEDMRQLARARAPTISGADGGQTVRRLAPDGTFNEYVAPADEYVAPPPSDPNEAWRQETGLERSDDC
jgi:hypothetical protein